MFGLIKNVIYLVILIFLIMLVGRLEYKGKEVRNYVHDFVRTPLAQEGVKQVKKAVDKIVHKDLSGDEEAEPLEDLTSRERKELEELLKEAEEQ